MNQKTYPPCPKFNDHGSSCKGHSNAVLDCTFETKEEVDLLKKIIGNYIDTEEN